MKTTTVKGDAYTDVDVDTFAITDGHYIAYIPIEDTSDKAFTIRVEPTRNNQKAGCKYIEDYLCLK